MESVRYERRGDVALVLLDHPPVNALSVALREGLRQRLDEAAGDPDVLMIVLAGAGRCFCGGADIREFNHPQNPPTLPEVIARMEECPKPIVAAMHGVALGGGFELALGCHYRVGDSTARVALPEVKLGIIPGAGGTQRLPRLIGLEPALDIILGGDPVRADRAAKLGILDQLAEGDVIEAAIAFARRVVKEGAPLKRARDMDLPAGDAKALLDQARKDVSRRMRGQNAPLVALESVANGFTMSFADALRRERELFMECRGSEQAQAQRHVFFAERGAAKVPDVPEDTPALPIRSAAVIGCGTMGRGIAITLANAGLPVRVLDSSAEALGKGIDAIRKTYADQAAKGRLTEAEMAERVGRIVGTSDYAELKGSDIVIEAVFEEMDLKKQVFQALDRVCKPEAILATNTSTLNVDEIALATGRPGKVMGTHFFSPANVMRLLENVRGKATAKETIATVMRLSKTLGKVGVLVGVCDGFVGNRMYHAYTRQAHFLLEEGASIPQIDKVIADFGFPMGPFTVNDVSGLDVSWRVRQRQAKTRPKNMRYSPIADRLCEQGRFGQKTGAGWYRYEKGSRTPIPDPAVAALVEGVSKELGIKRRAIADDEIRERCIYALVNEGAKILDEGVVLRPGDIDVIWVYGYGFPVWRGGPMFYADRAGLGTVYDALSRLADTHGEMFKPAALIQRLAREGKGFGG